MQFYIYYSNLLHVIVLNKCRDKLENFSLQRITNTYFYDLLLHRPLPQFHVTLVQLQRQSQNLPRMEATVSLVLRCFLSFFWKIQGFYLN